MQHLLSSEIIVIGPIISDDSDNNGSGNCHVAEGIVAMVQVAAFVAVAWEW